ncbi:hypothetical protein NSK_006812 [Nannochloropsis salina CCMP1776]|uniref:Uncharacterized protein n=1 Tax=Nannochloropsis salina CCMP1776 TaxID=1027361 RepID=A0A4D9CQU5_9STRA|nr:hypothetical protein NSK_006812 [Nannochloropsis salina CCMP1776]|eukprot:TFJ81561.1 hypothetical protein NSK_006812 [Nannochloropsis salina CCMP1776]
MPSVPTPTLAAPSLTATHTSNGPSPSILIPSPLPASPGSKRHKVTHADPPPRPSPPSRLQRATPGTTSFSPRSPFMQLFLVVDGQYKLGLMLPRTATIKQLRDTALGCYQAWREDHLVTPASFPSPATKLSRPAPQARLRVTSLGTWRTSTPPSPPSSFPSSPPPCPALFSSLRHITPRTLQLGKAQYWRPLSRLSALVEEELTDTGIVMMRTDGRPLHANPSLPPSLPPSIPAEKEGGGDGKKGQEGGNATSEYPPLGDPGDRAHSLQGVKTAPLPPSPSLLELPEHRHLPPWRRYLLGAMTLVPTKVNRFKRQVEAAVQVLPEGGGGDSGLREGLREVLLKCGKSRVGMAKERLGRLLANGQEGRGQEGGREGRREGGAAEEVMRLESGKMEGAGSGSIGSGSSTESEGEGSSSEEDGGEGGREVSMAKKNGGARPEDEEGGGGGGGGGGRLTGEKEAEGADLARPWRVDAQKGRVARGRRGKEEGEEG